jgi:poly-gamma-glutamate synthesis protein (capsule biosynthesis protein)
VLCSSDAIITNAADEVPSQEKPFKIVFVGDIMLDGGPGHVVGNGGDPFAEVGKILRGADLSIGNLECVISRKGEPLVKSYTFLGRPECIPLLKKYFSAVSVANNHSGDYGKEAFADQLDTFDREKLPYFGGGRNLIDARKPLVLESRGRKVALLGYCDFPPKSFAADEKTPGTAWLVEADVLADIRAAKAAGADLVIPYLHWGDEMEPASNEEQKTLARKMIDAGADAVVGMHPHVTQTVEYYRGKPIIYSLGNFVFDYFAGDPPVWNGWIAELSFDGRTAPDLTLHVVELDPAGVPHLLPKPAEEKP